MGNTMCNDCRTATSLQLCFDTCSTTIAQPTFNLPSHLEPTHTPTLPLPIIQRLSLLSHYPLKIPKCGLIGLQQLGPYKNSLDDNIYEGEWLNGKPEGKGKVFYSTGEYLEGEFHEGHPCGVVRVVFEDGSYFEGQMLDYAASGGGKYAKEGMEFEGVFGGGKGRGKALCGIIKMKDMSIVSFNLETGKGVIEWSSKKKYSGDLSAELYPEGKGRMVLEEGRVLEGEWRGGEYQGEGEREDDMRSTTSDFNKRKSGRGMNGSKGGAGKKRGKQFYGVEDEDVRRFMRVGVPEIGRLDFSCQ